MLHFLCARHWASHYSKDVLPSPRAAGHVFYASVISLQFNIFNIKVAKIVMVLYSWYPLSHFKSSLYPWCIITPVEKVRLRKVSLKIPQPVTGKVRIQSHDWLQSDQAYKAYPGALYAVTTWKPVGNADFQSQPPDLLILILHFDTIPRWVLFPIKSLS